MTARSAARKSAIRDFASYASRFPADIQEALSRVRSTVLEAVPGATETISYNMPAFRLHDQVVVYFAAFKAHLGLYPPVRGSAALERATAPYAGPKGNLQFPYGRPIPYALIARVVRHRAAELRRAVTRSPYSSARTSRTGSARSHNRQEL
jgi:uncharacterized protein YdhG (YjbR/CyaY superfamily)